MVENVIIMAGGEGRRLRPLTELRPKPLMPLLDEPVVGMTLRLLRRHGIRSATLTVCYRAEDIRRGCTTKGPHRDDIGIMLNGRDVRVFGSQGQQRSVVLALKLGEANVMAQSIGEEPVILLDDVLSELDDSRQEYLLNHMKERQVFFTCCDPSGIRLLRDGKVFYMKEGCLTGAPL